VTYRPSDEEALEIGILFAIVMLAWWLSRG